MQLGPIQREFVRCLGEDNIPQSQYHLFEVVRGEKVCRHSSLGVLVMTCLANGYVSQEPEGWVRFMENWQFEGYLSMAPPSILSFVGLTNLGERKLLEMHLRGVSFSEVAQKIRDIPSYFFYKSV